MSAELVWHETRVTGGDCPVWIRLMFRLKEIARLRKCDNTAFYGEMFGVQCGRCSDEATAKKEMIEKLNVQCRDILDAIDRGVPEISE